MRIKKGAALPGAAAKGDVYCMNRLLSVQTAMLDLIQAQEGKLPERDQSLNWERIHMVGSARLAWIMAEERGEDPSLAACACSVHDIGRILTGRQEGHAETGREACLEFLSPLSLFSPAELELISRVVANHSRKSEQGAALEEIIKDADVVDSHLCGSPFTMPGQKERFDRWTHRHAL